MDFSMKGGARVPHTYSEKKVWKLCPLGGGGGPTPNGKIHLAFISILIICTPP